MVSCYCSVSQLCYRYRGTGAVNATASDQPTARRDPDLELMTPRLRPSTSHELNHDEVEKEEVELEEPIGLMSELVSGSHNERTRRQYLHVSDWSSAVPRSLWWSGSDSNPDDRILSQMRHVPLNYQRDDETLRTIYMPGGQLLGPFHGALSLIHI